MPRVIIYLLKLRPVPYEQNEIKFTSFFKMFNQLIPIEQLNYFQRVSPETYQKLISLLEEKHRCINSLIEYKQMILDKLKLYDKECLLKKYHFFEASFLYNQTFDYTYRGPYTRIEEWHGRDVYIKEEIKRKDYFYIKYKAELGIFDWRPHMNFTV